MSKMSDLDIDTKNSTQRPQRSSDKTISEYVLNLEEYCSFLEEVIEDGNATLAEHQREIDTFCGSGSSLEAGVKKKLFVSGCDKLMECYVTSLKRMGEL